MEKNKAIGIYDSGVGGLTVYKELLELLPEENYMYYGDTKNLPYGDHTKEELSDAMSLMKTSIEFYISQYTTNTTLVRNAKKNYMLLRNLILSHMR